MKKEEIKELLEGGTNGRKTYFAAFILDEEKLEIDLRINGVHYKECTKGLGDLMDMINIASVLVRTEILEYLDGDTARLREAVNISKRRVVECLGDIDNISNIEQGLLVWKEEKDGLV